MVKSFIILFSILLASTGTDLWCAQTASSRQSGSTAGVKKSVKRPARRVAPRKGTAATAGVKEVAVLETTSGPIVIEFFPDIAPEHVKNFKEHVKAGRYLGTYFHRVMPGFMIQGGDFNTKDNDASNDGMGGWSYKGEGTNLKAEISQRKHLRGILSMARGRSLDSAGSQFFIMHAEYPSLDGQYTIFGRVLSGMETVDKIATQPGTPGPGGGVNPRVKQSILKARIEKRRISVPPAPAAKK